MRHKLADYFESNQLTEDVAGEGLTKDVSGNESAKDYAGRGRAFCVSRLKSTFYAYIVMVHQISCGSSRASIDWNILLLIVSYMMYVLNLIMDI